MELLYKAGELSQSEIDTPIEMEVTLDQFLSNIGYVRQIIGRLTSQNPFQTVSFISVVYGECITTRAP